MLTPLYDQIVVKINELEDEKTVGNIIVKQNPFVRPYEEGVVVSVGKGYSKDGEIIPLTVKEGDTVVFRKAAGILIEDGITEFMVTSESTVLAIRS